MEEVSEIMVMKKILLNAQILQLKTSFRNKIKVFNIPKIYAFVLKFPFEYPLFE